MSAANHRRKLYLPGVSILYHVDNTWLLLNRRCMNWRCMDVNLFLDTEFLLLSQTTLVTERAFVATFGIWPHNVQ